MPAPPSDDVRRVNFGAFIERAVVAAFARGMSVKAISEATGVSKSTWFRWRKGEWVRDPAPDDVRAFCEALAVSVEAAHRALGWVDGKPQQPDPLRHPDLIELQRLLEDPNVSSQEKAAIEEFVRILTARVQSRRAKSTTSKPRPRRS